MRTFSIDQMQPEDWPFVRRIYLEGIATGMATFEIEAPSWEAWDASHLMCGRLVARNDRDVMGWAALSPVSARRVYAGVAEVSIYVGADNRRRGVGRGLLERLIIESERNDIWTLQAVIFPDNSATLALHSACGFREVGRRERIGKLNGTWRDTILLERRSKMIEVE